MLMCFMKLYNGVVLSIYSISVLFLSFYSFVSHLKLKYSLNEAITINYKYIL